MEKILELSECGKLKDNKSICNGDNIEMKNSSIIFSGKGNILVLDNHVRLVNSKIHFKGDNCVVYLRSNPKNDYYLNIAVSNENCVYIGERNYFNGTLNMVVSEYQNILMGDNSVFAFGIWMRTGDAHALYDIHTRKRINYGKSILVGDHVWLGQSVMVLKGTQFGSGAVLGGGSLISNKVVPSHTLFAGNPAKKLKEDVAHLNWGVHGWTRDKMELYDEMNEEVYVYEKPEKDCKSLKEIDQLLKEKIKAEDKLEIIQKYLVEEKDANRFYIGKESKRKGIFR